ncbi:hypothetical protein QBC47DRAFT_220819 [Echria macrotheca]|uniref:Uncharacterized protein n=1 Tax=Echria macrotheca TaxID=438768 RepID=A0AAJ0F5I3_9PEZI|nr:hypothetical protein QBC47DRAFT_220819 [Echria macrotheca]
MPRAIPTWSPYSAADLVYSGGPSAKLPASLGVSHHQEARGVCASATKHSIMCVVSASILGLTILPDAGPMTFAVLLEEISPFVGIACVEAILGGMSRARCATQVSPHVSRVPSRPVSGPLKIALIALLINGSAADQAAMGMGMGNSKAADGGGGATRTGRDLSRGFPVAVTAKYISCPSRFMRFGVGMVVMVRAPRPVGEADGGGRRSEGGARGVIIVTLCC